MIRRVKLQGATWHWVDPVAVEQAIAQPSRSMAVRFIVSFTAFALFLAALLIVVLADTQVTSSAAVGRGLQEAVSKFDGLNSIDDVGTYVDQVVGSLTRWPDGTPGTPRLPVMLDTHVLIGTIRIVQHRVAPIWECTDAVTGTVRCAPDFDSVQRDLEARPDAPAFIGIRTLRTFPYVIERLRCPDALSCEFGTESRLRPDIVFYPDSGYVIEMYGSRGDATNTPAVVNETTRRSEYWVNGSLVTNGPADLFADFLDSRTRHIRVTALLYNPQLYVFTQLNVHIEFPVTGGVFPFTTVFYLPLINRSDRILYVLAEVYLWVYVAYTCAFEIFLFVRGFQRRAICLRCACKGKALTVTRCQQCGKPLPTTFIEPEDCTWCTAVMPAIEHICWKQRVQNPWTWTVIANNLLFLCARVITLGARSEAETLVAAASAATVRMADEALQGGGSSSSRLIADATVLFSPVARIADVANDFLSAAVVIGAIRSYRYIGRFNWSQRFLRVFSSGGLLLLLFFLTFVIVFLGFAISFHLILGETADRFTALGEASRTTFFALLMVVDWTDFKAYHGGWIFTVVYVTFVFSCALVMLNVLISIVTYEYRVSVRKRTTDVEAQSLKFIFRPLKRRLEERIPLDTLMKSPPSSPTRKDPQQQQQQQRDDDLDMRKLAESGESGGGVGDSDDEFTLHQSGEQEDRGGQQQQQKSKQRDDDEEAQRRQEATDELTKADVTAQLVADSLRSVNGLKDVVEHATTEALRDEIRELGEELTRLTDMARSCAASASAAATGTSSSPPQQQQQRRGRAGTLSKESAAFLGIDPDEI